MGLFDDLNSLFNKGVAGASRVADTASLKLKMGSLDSRRRTACAQLGESLYDLVMATPELQMGRESILAEIAACDQERESLQAELERIEREAAEARSASVVFACPTCGVALDGQSRFCPHCGAAQPEPQPAAQPESEYAAQPAGQQPEYTQVQPQQPQAQPVSQQPGAAPQQPAGQPAPQQPGTAPVIEVEAEQVYEPVDSAK